MSWLEWISWASVVVPVIAAVARWEARRAQRLCERFCEEMDVVMMPIYNDVSPSCGLVLDALDRAEAILDRDELHCPLPIAYCPEDSPRFDRFDVVYPEAL